MGFRYRKSVNAGPFRLNFSKRGVGYSVGVPGCRVSTYADGRRYLVLSIPGTGISWWKRLPLSVKRQSAYPSTATIPQVGRTSGKGKPPSAPADLPNPHQQNSSPTQGTRPRIRIK